MIQDAGLINELNHLVKDMETSNSDILVAVYGKERSGKSTFAANLGKVLDPTFNAKTLPGRIALTFEDFTEIGPNAQPYEVCWWDEAGAFGRRSTYGGLNRALLNFFQQAGGSKRIYLLVFPELGEIDKKVIQRSRLFFETVRKNGKFYVQGWTQDQIRRKIRESRLFAAKSRAACWAGSSRVATKIFQCDYRGIEAEMKVYSELKMLNLKRTDAALRAHYRVNLSEIVVLSRYEISKTTGLNYSRSQAYQLVKDELKKAEDTGNVADHIERTPRDIFITDSDLVKNLVKNVLADVLQKHENNPQVAIFTNNLEKSQIEETA